MLGGIEDDIAAALPGDCRGSVGDRVFEFDRGAAPILRDAGHDVRHIGALLIHGIGKTAFCVADRDALVFFLEHVINGLDNLCTRVDPELSKLDRYGIA